MCTSGPPVARFTVPVNCEFPFTRTFTNRSIAAETSTWDFGDGSTSTLRDPVHTYASPGRYTVLLRVANGECSDIFKATVVVIDEHPDFTIDNVASCKNAVSVFTATNIDTNNIASYAWNFGDTSRNFTSDISSISYQYTEAGVYSPSLTITDKTGCKRSVQHDSEKTVFGPKAAFDSPAGACVNSLVTFTDQSQPYQNYAITSWVMNYGDGGSDSSSVPSFSHTYTDTGKYHVTLKVTDNYGCTDTAYKVDSMSITDPSASFSLADSVACNNSLIKFINNSQGQNLNHAWSFGDGTTSSTTSPSHQYLLEGPYDISLIITDRYGCTDTTVKAGGVVIGNAKAEFSLSDSIISCPNAQISFINNSTYVKSLTWDFNDGSFSNLKDPLHYFLEAGTYFIKLKVSGYGNCTDSMVKKLVVNGPSGVITYSPITKCSPATINFNAAVLNNTSFLWDFNDGTVDSTTGTSISHTYTTPGYYSPKLYLYDTSINCIVEVKGRDTIAVSALESFIRPHNLVLCDSNSIQFSDSSIVQFSTIKSYLWNFGDGTTSNLANPTHLYTTAGNYPINLTVTTESGCVDSAVASSVKVVKTPDVRISGMPEICADALVNFTGALLQADTSLVQWSLELW
jgi:PKD repeat protein